MRQKHKSKSHRNKKRFGKFVRSTVDGIPVIRRERVSKDIAREKLREATEREDIS